MLTARQLIVNKTFQRLLLALGLLAIAGVFNLRWPGSANDVTDEALLDNAGYSKAQIIIPKINVEAPIVFVKEASEEAYQEALNKGVVRYPESATPGEVGNVYLFGHSSNTPGQRGKFNTVFRDLPKLKAGDEVILSYLDLSFTYTVLESKVVEPNDLSVLSQYTGERKILTLQTSYPVGKADQRYIIIAEINKTK